MARRAATGTRAVTLADVARHAGVSAAVVSYVINDGPRPVAAATRSRVLDSVSLLGYRPNSHARALMSGRVGIVGLIHPGTANPFFGEYSDVMYATAARSGTALLMASSGGDADVERTLIESLADRNVDGIISITSLTRADVSELHDPGIPLLFLNCPFAIPGYRTIGIDGVDGSRRLVEHLLDDHGYADVALIAGETAEDAPEDRELGWRLALRQHRRPEGPLVRTPFTLDGGYAGTHALLRSATPPRAIFASSDLQAIGVLHALHESGRRVPEDVAVVSFDGIAEAAHAWPPLTLMQQPLTEMADAAFAGLLGSEPPRHTVFPMESIIRRSCGCGVTP